MEPIANLRILVIEDDPRMVELLRTGLWEKGHSIVTATTAKEGRQLAEENSFDAIVLDIGLPDGNGTTIAQHLLQRPDRPAIVMVTALDQEDQVVHGLDAGADDYITKPFSFPELVARITSAARRTRIAASGDSTFGRFRFDIAKRRLFHDYEEIHLSPNEFLLLRALVLHRSEVVSRRQLLQAVWGDAPISHGALDTLVSSLRDKLNQGPPGLISTVRNTGYSLTEAAIASQRSEP